MACLEFVGTTVLFLSCPLGVHPWTTLDFNAAHACIPCIGCDILGRLLRRVSLIRKTSRWEEETSKLISIYMPPPPKNSEVEKNMTNSSKSSFEPKNTTCTKVICPLKHNLHWHWHWRCKQKSIYILHWPFKTNFGALAKPSTMMQANRAFTRGMWTKW